MLYDPRSKVTDTNIIRVTVVPVPRTHCIALDTVALSEVDEKTRSGFVVNTDDETEDLHTINLLHA